MIIYNFAFLIPTLSGDAFAQSPPLHKRARCLLPSPHTAEHCVQSDHSDQDVEPSAEYEGNADESSLLVLPSLRPIHTEESFLCTSMVTPKFSTALRAEIKLLKYVSFAMGTREKYKILLQSNCKLS